ncbi:hypothetical protein CRUP_036407 [Coryphaenoides rupestris]|nr:hypothetical protein CRUP_036407 [Coryphaenoides rupestris]
MTANETRPRDRGSHGNQSTESGRERERESIREGVRDVTTRPHHPTPTTRVQPNTEARVQRARLRTGATLSPRSPTPTTATRHPGARRDPDNVCSSQPELLMSAQAQGPGATAQAQGPGATILALFIIQVERMRGCRSSVFLFLFWVLAVVCSLVPLRAKIQLVLDEGIGSDIVRYLAFFSYFTLQLAQLFLCCFADQRPEGKTATEKNPCPVKDASFLSKILFWWFAGLVVKGYRTPLEADDLWTLREEDTSDKIISDLEQEWTAECAKIKKQEKALASGVALGGKLPDQAQLLRKLQREQSSGFFLLRTLARKFGPYFLTGTLCIVFHDAFMFAIPQVLSLLLGFMRDDTAPLWKGYFYATLMFLLSCLQSLFNHQYMYTCFTVGMRVKTAVMGLVYRKSLVINSSARRTCTVGEIVNLVSADTQKLMDFVVYFNAVWLAPIEIALCLFFLWQHLGPSALAGIATVILIFPLNGYIAKKRSKLQPTTTSGTRRVRQATAAFR